MNSSSSPRLTILIVDDSQFIRGRLREILAEAPCLDVIAEAGDGLEAIRQFERFRPQAVVLDIQMPGLSGVEVLRRIKSVAPRCTVVMMTSFNHQLFREVCGIFGADAYFHKATEFELVPGFLSSQALKLNPSSCRAT